MKKENIEVTYRNEENLNLVPTEKSKTSFKNLYTYFKGSIAGLLTYLATNKIFIWVGNIGQDEIIKKIAEWETRFRHGTKVPDMDPIPFLANVLEKVGDFVTISWATVMANPTLSAAIIGALVALGAVAIGTIKKYRANRKAKKSGKVREAEKALTK